MPRQNISDLRSGARKHQPSNPRNCKQGGGGFETQEDARKEDKARVRLLRSVSCDAIRTGLGERYSSELADKLERGLQNGKIPRSTASARAWRKVRSRVTGELIRLQRSEQHCRPGRRCNTAFVTIIPISDRWRVRGPDLCEVNARKLLSEFRVDLARIGQVPHDGWGFFALHCEYHKDTDTWHFHIHGVIAGAMIERIEQLRMRYPGKYRWSSASNYEETHQPIRISGGDTRDPFLRTLYILQGWWPWKLRYHPRTGEKLNRAKRRRIPNPRFAQHLLWLDQYRFSDLVLMYGLRVQSRRLHRTGKLYTNAGGL